MDGKRIKLTRKVKRGLVLVRGLMVDYVDPNAAPGFTTTRKWRAGDVRDMNAALAWMEQVEADLAAVTVGGAA